MSEVKKTGERGVTYSILDRDCITRECFSPGRYQHRGATSSGSRATGHYSTQCMQRAHHGCPTPLPEPTEDLRVKRKAEGWKNV